MPVVSRTACGPVWSVVATVSIHDRRDAVRSGCWERNPGFGFVLGVLLRCSWSCYMHTQYLHIVYETKDKGTDNSHKARTGRPNIIMLHGSVDPASTRVTNANR